MFLLPGALLSEFLDGTLTWFKAAVCIGFFAALMAIPLLLAGRRPNGS